MISKRLIYKYENNELFIRFKGLINNNLIPYNYIEHNTSYKIIKTENNNTSESKSNNTSESKSDNSESNNTSESKSDNSESEIDNSNVSIHKEILRSIIIKKLINLFIDKIRTLRIKNLGLIFKYNKLEDYVQKWCWLQYENPYIQDIVIPYIKNETYNFDEFIYDFNYTMKKANIKVSDIQQLINNVKMLLKNSYLDFINTKYENIKINKIREEENVTLICKYPDNNSSNKYPDNNSSNKSSDNNSSNEYKVVISNDLYIRLVKKCNCKDNSKCDMYIFCLIFRYSYIDAENQQLAIHRKIKDMFKSYGVNFELYGSAINALSDNYCSLFYDIEKYFGSKGNFFDIELKSGIYWCNPPYIDRLMTKTAHKLIETMNKTNNIAFIITIPIWDTVTKSMNFSEITRNHTLNRDDFDDYPIYALLKPYIKDELIIPKNRIPYFNYRHNKPINARDTYMLIVYKDIQYTDFHSVFDKIIELDKTDFFLLNN